MKKILVIVLVSLMSLVFNATVLAGAGHDHTPITKEKAKQLAMKKLDSLVAKGKIDKSWTGKPVVSVGKKSFSKGPEWVVIFENKEVSDKSKRKLYMFYALDGHYLATNYTGN